MTKTGMVAGLASALGMLILILDGKTAFAGAADGVQLCIRTVIPSLFPFFVLSGILRSSLIGAHFPISMKRLGVPKGAESLVVAGFLGGYPVGAQTIAAAYRNGSLSKERAERMLGFCNNAGPSFLFGMIGPLFPDMKYPWMLWTIHIASALAVAFLLPQDEMEAVSVASGKPLRLTEALSQAIRVMASVCGWIVLFRIALAFLQRWILWLLPKQWQVIASGLLELSNGCCSLTAIEDLGHRFLISAGILAFGGLCVSMQTVSVTQGLRLRYYFPGKLLQTAVSILLCRFVVPVAPEIVGIALISSIFLVLSLRKMQNSSSIPQTVGV